MKIRSAELKDLEAMVAIYNQSIAVGQLTADTTPVCTEGRRKWFDDHTPDQYPLWVAESGDMIVGYLTISAYRPGRQALRQTAEVSYYVHFDHHRQGVASALLQFAIRACPSLQIKTLFAILMDNNQGSVHLLQKYGFEKWGHLPRVAEFDGIEVGHYYYGLRIDTLHSI
ncbi:GNAT family N-acetyltransferase [Kiritimatiellota bacterium B12222]|nr:GNAT family N-acetyltransferase [Kiritimatiellota bacterium B12222]